ncbi:MAG: hypothetical protein AB7S75_20490 [Desulfococcaceae bacterium]
MKTKLALSIKQTVKHDGIIISLNKIRGFEGKQVEIIILPELDSDTPKNTKSKSLKNSLSTLSEKYRDLKPFKNIDALQWEREIRNDWQNSAFGGKQ